MADMDDKREKAKVLLAGDLEQKYLAGFLTVEDIVDQIFPIPDGTTKGEAKPSFAVGLQHLVSLHGFRRIFGSFYAKWHQEYDDALTLFELALKDFYPFVVELFKMLGHDGTVRAFQELLHTRDDDGHHPMWRNLVLAFPYRELRSCAELAQKRADEAMADAPEATVVEEEVVEEIEPSDSRPPWPNHE